MAYYPKQDEIVKYFFKYQGESFEFTSSNTPLDDDIYFQKNEVSGTLKVSEIIEISYRAERVPNGEILFNSSENVSS